MEFALYQSVIKIKYSVNLFEAKQKLNQKTYLTY